MKLPKFSIPIGIIVLVAFLATISCKKDDPYNKVASISLNKTTIVKKVGETEQLTVTVMPNIATEKLLLKPLERQKLS